MLDSVLCQVNTTRNLTWKDKSRRDSAASRLRVHVKAKACEYNKLNQQSDVSNESNEV